MQHITGQHANWLENHHLNVLWSVNPHRRVAAVIDWDRLRRQPRLREVARAGALTFAADQPGGARALDLDRLHAFLAGYRRERPLSNAEAADAANRLWWSWLCDLWQLDRRYNRNDTSADHLILPTCRLLEWWSSHLDDVAGVFAGSRSPAPSLGATCT